MSRMLLLVGVLLVAAGSYILVKGFSVTSHREVLDVGPLEASVEERRAVPPWTGGVGVAAGLVLIVASLGGRSRSRA